MCVSERERYGNLKPMPIKSETPSQLNTDAAVGVLLGRVRAFVGDQQRHNKETNTKEYL